MTRVHIPAEPRHCSACGLAMPLTGPRRIRAGKLTCSDCDSSWSPGANRPNRPHHPARSLTVEARHLTRELLSSQAALLSEEDVAALEDRPKTWAECARETGPCPWVSCRHHLYLDVSPIGSIKINHPNIEPEDLEHPCALRLATAGAHHLEEVGVRLNLTRERVRQLEEKALVQIRRLGRRIDDLRPRPL